MKLKVVSFNIRCCDDPNGYAIAQRAPRLEQVVKPYDADVIGLQEYREPWEQPIARMFGEYVLFHKYRNETEDKEAAPILWKKDRFDCLKKGYFWLSDTPQVESRGWDARFNCYRMCQYVVLRHKESGQPFTFMNTHFGFGDVGQVDSAHLLQIYNRQIGDYPTVITGDFNMEMSSPGYAAMTERYTDVNAVTARYAGPTFHGYDPARYHEHIDYCFVDSRVKPLRQDVIDNTVEGYYPSDHFGLYTEVEL